MLARSLATQFGALSVTNALKTDAEMREPLKNPSELTIPLQAAPPRRRSSMRPPASPARRDVDPGTRRRRGQRSVFMVDFAHALSRLGIDVVTFNFLYTEQGRRIPDRAPVARSLLRRGDRYGPCRGRERAAARCSSAASRWAGGSRRRWRPRIRRCRWPAWCCSDTRCTRRENRPNGATNTWRRLADRCCSCRAPATPSARRKSSSRFLASCPAALMHPVTDGDHSFKLPQGSGGAGGDLRGVQRTMSSGSDAYVMFQHLAARRKSMAQVKGAAPRRRP